MTAELALIDSGMLVADEGVIMLLWDWEVGDWLLGPPVEEPLEHATRARSSTASYMTWEGSGDRFQPLVFPKHVDRFVSDACDCRYASKSAEKLTIFDEQTHLCRCLRTLNTLWTGVYGWHILINNFPRLVSYPSSKPPNIRGE